MVTTGATRSTITLTIACPVFAAASVATAVKTTDGPGPTATLLATKVAGTPREAGMTAAVTPFTTTVTAVASCTWPATEMNCAAVESPGLGESITTTGATRSTVRSRVVVVECPVESVAMIVTWFEPSVTGTLQE